MKKNNPESSSLHVKEELNNVVIHNYASKQFSQSESGFSSAKNKNKLESKKSSQQELLTPTDKTINSHVTDELLVPNSSWTSMNKSDSFKTKLEDSSPKIPDEMFGIGTNKNVSYSKYFI